MVARQLVGRGHRWGLVGALIGVSVSLVAAGGSSYAGPLPPSETSSEADVSIGLLSGSAPGQVELRQWSSSKDGRLVVTFKTPASVLANLRVLGKKKTTLTKPTTGRTARLVLPPGRYKLTGDPATLNGRTYEPRLTVNRVKVVKNKTTKITVRMKKIRLATDLEVTKLTSTSASLVWRAPRGATVKLRRTAGDTPATRPTAGTAVKLTKKNLKTRTTTNTGLTAGGTYTYTLFSKVDRNRWEPSPALTTNTPAVGSPAAYVLKPGATLVQPGDRDKVAVTGDGTVVLHPATNRPDPALGAAVILPISDQLPGGLVGKVAAINPDGTLVLGEGDIPSAFDYLDLNYDLDQLPAQRITAKDLTSRPGGSPTGSSARGAPKFGCELSSGISTDYIDTALSYKPGGHARHHIDYNHFHIPVSASFDVEHTSTVTGTVTTSTGVSCGISGGVEVGFPIGPIPFLLKADIHGKVSTSGSQITTVTTTIGGRITGQLAGGKIQIPPGEPIVIDDSTFTKEAEITLELGTEVSFGPGIAAKDVAGAVAGLNANISLLEHSLKTISPGCGEINHSRGLTMGVKASIWLGPLTASTYANAIDKIWPRPGYPKPTPGCTTTPTPTPTPTPSPTPTPTPTPPPPPSGNDTWKSLSVGSAGEHMCGIKTDGTAWCWGDNYTGQLGNGTTTASTTPTRVAGDGAWTSLVRGNGYTCGIKTDATAWCWGSNYEGQLGGGSTTPSATPAQVPGGHWISLAAGLAHTCGIKDDRTAWCWGYNVSGQVGDGTTTGQDLPVPVAGDERWSSITAGDMHTCGIRDDGTAMCWGGNFFGQLGDGTTTDRSSPVTVIGGGPWTGMSAGGWNTCGTKYGARAAPENLWAHCWGNNQVGQLGINQSGDDNPHSTPFALDNGFEDSVSAAGAYVCLTDLTSNYSWCRGSNAYGQMGNGSTSPYLTAVSLGGNLSSTWTSLGLGRRFACAVDQEERAWCWGSNDVGQLGVGDRTARLSPALVADS